ncbi:fructosamine kinase family protein [Fodinicola feengrottensis]|uniref:Fructosamine kinase family protein n=1 Tax=Fodinicola feengrottensis TaxID=435914 RepID=A0ABP4SX92_9ACTN|nr:fructosamine kinase family protein [Fodinicola feengrottensis]
MEGGIDLAYVRAHGGTLSRLIEHQRIRMTPVPGGDICVAQRLTLDDGADLFAKTLENAPPGLFAAEAAGLRWLAEPRAVPVPEVIAVADDLLVLEWIPPGRPTAESAATFGRQLAQLHAAGADSFGAPWPGYVGSLPVSNEPADDWPTFYAQRRIQPALRLAVDRHRIGPADVASVEKLLDRLAEVAGPAEPPARIHGDLWAGNVHCGQDGTIWLIDPAAYGGHRETDLAMLTLFSPPHLDRVLSAYAEQRPLADGWRDRLALHQIHPLVVHAALFGGGYGARAGEHARLYL